VWARLQCSWKKITWRWYWVWEYKRRAESMVSLDGASDAVCAAYAEE
jgi:hypothetical protein